MKMSDVFILPITDMRVLGNTYKEDQAAAHAINQYDALVAMNAELVEALDLVLAITETEEATKYMIEMTLRKAKELSQ